MESGEILIFLAFMTLDIKEQFESVFFTKVHGLQSQA